MTSDPYQSYESMDYGKGHGKGHPKVPESNSAGMIIIGLAILVILLIQMFRPRRNERNRWR